MAYMGRGGFSSFGGGNIGGELGTKDNAENSNGLRERMYYRGRFFRRYYYIPLDNTYVIFQMIATFIILIVVGITFLVTYKSAIIDPIENMKNSIMWTHTIITLSLLVITLLANYFSKDKRALIKRLLIILAIAVIALIVFFVIKIELNSIYTNNKFEQIYEEEYKTLSSDKRTRVDIGLTGMKIKTEKEYFVDECIKLYNIFNIKTYGIIVLNILLTLLLIYQISKVATIQDKKDRLNKDDAILFDEEKNVKI